MFTPKSDGCNDIIYILYNIFAAAHNNYQVQEPF